MSTRPWGAARMRSTTSNCAAASPRVASGCTAASVANSRRTTFSPCSPGRVLTRASTAVPSTAIRARPSCGIRRSAMSSPDRILSRLTTAAEAPLGSSITSRSTPSTRCRIRSPSRCGSTWRSLAPSRTASASIALTRRTVGASSTAERSARSSSGGSSGSSAIAVMSRDSSVRVHSRRRWSRTWVSVATTTSTSCAPVCSRTSSRATTLVGSAAATRTARPTRASTTI